MGGNPLSALERVSSGRFRSLVSPNERPAFVLAVALIVAFVAEVLTGGPGRWGLSGRALAEGRFETVLTHMFSHAGLWHLFLNATALATLAAPVVARFGWRRPGLMRFAGLFLASGLAGAAMFLLLHPAGSTPMVGASGAICGFWGAGMRLPAESDAPLRPLLSPEVLRELRRFAVANATLFALLFAASGGQGGGLAWEAHLGGLLFGLLALPLFLKSAAETAEATPA